VKRGKSIHAIILSFLTPGIAQIYLKAYLKGLSLFILYLFILSSIYLLPLSAASLLMIYIIFLSAVLYDALLTITRQNHMTSTSIKRGLLYLMLALLLLPGSHLLIRSTLVLNCRIHQESMSTALRPGDHVAVNRLSYMRGKPESGEIVLFKHPQMNRLFIKRVAGVGKDRIMIENGHYILNGIRLEDNGRDACAFLDLCRQSADKEIVIPEGHLFVLGDNQFQSNDSRDFGPIKVGTIKGKAIKIFWSFDIINNKIRWQRIGRVL